MGTNIACAVSRMLLLLVAWCGKSRCRAPLPPGTSFLASCAHVACPPRHAVSGTKKLAKPPFQPAPASSEPEYPTALVTTCVPPGTKKLVKFPRKLAQLPPQEATVGGGQWGWCGVSVGAG